MPDSLTRTPVLIRWMIRSDLLDVLAVERASYDPAWTEDDFLRELRRRECIGMVAEIGGRVAGFMVYDLHREWVEVLKLAVHPDWRRRGLGRRLVVRLAGKLGWKRDRLTMPVSDADLPAHLFLRATGWRAVQVLRAEPGDPPGDIYVFELTRDPGEGFA